MDSEPHGPTLKRLTLLHRLLPRHHALAFSTESGFCRRTALRTITQRTLRTEIPRTGLQARGHRNELPRHQKRRPTHHTRHRKSHQKPLVRTRLLQPPRNRQRELLLLGHRHRRHTVCRTQLPHRQTHQRPLHH